MIKLSRFTTLLTMTILMFLSVGVHADRRNFVWTYQYYTIPSGSAEMENYFDYKLPDNDSPENGTFVQQVEIELGLTERMDFSLYQTFSQTNDEEFHYDGFKLRTRYRLFEAGQYMVDPTLYLEFKRPADHAEKSELEGKLILAKNYKRWIGAVNIVIEQELRSNPEYEWGYDIAVGYEFIPAFSAGLESKGNFDSGSEGHQGIGPTLSYARGPIWFSAGFLLPLTDYTNDFEFRYILGIDL